MALTDKTGRSLVEFLNWVAEKGLLKRNTAQALRVASEKVLDVDDDWESSDVSEIDVDALLRRFENLRAADYTPGSLSTYQSRFRRALAMYLDYVAKPAGWSPDIQRRKSKTETGTDETRSGVSPGSERARSESRPADHLVEYPFPVRPGCLGRLALPPDLTTAEARRVAAFVTSLALGAGEGDE